MTLDAKMRSVDAQANPLVMDVAAMQASSFRHFPRTHDVAPEDDAEPVRAWPGISLPARMRFSASLQSVRKGWMLQLRFRHEGRSYRRIIGGGRMANLSSAWMEHVVGYE